ncbi:unnamed protein product [Linum tenue]|uniref:FBD domain-containing protein n=1 Tax=Linum tenue TaxID=586396 RepID=A0AAV0L2U2_9ROSI|nr:unnamed protein product [Linum tenue]
MGRQLKISRGNFSDLEIRLSSAPRDVKYQMELHLTSAPCLRSLGIIELRGRGSYKLNIESASAAPNLKILNLSVPKGFTQSHLDEFVSKLPSLEHLYLEITYGGSSSEMSKMRVSSHQLRVLELHDRVCGAEKMNLRELEIDAPNLVTVRYMGRRFRFPSKINVVNVSYDCRFVVEGYSVPSATMCLTFEWFLRLRQSLSTLSPFHLVLQLHGLRMLQQVSFDLSQVECTSPPVTIQHLQLETSFVNSPDSPEDEFDKAPPEVVHCDIQNDATFLDGLFWACRPKFIDMTHHSDVDRRFAEFVYEQLTNKDSAKCCVDTKCWRHELKDVKIENAVHDCSSEAVEVFKNVSPGATISFMLTWC